MPCLSDPFIPNTHLQVTACTRPDVIRGIPCFEVGANFYDMCSQDMYFQTGGLVCIQRIIYSDPEINADKE